jgi:hypothetical protein
MLRDKRLGKKKPFISNIVLLPYVTDEYVYVCYPVKWLVDRTDIMLCC